MFRTTVAVLCTWAAVWGASPQAGAAESAARYAIIVRKDVAGGTWGKVVEALEARHKGKTFAYEASLDEVSRDVGAFHPRYVCFVCPPTENFPGFVPQANKFCRTLDEDPYVDAIWGIVTGDNEDHALELVNARPVAVKRVFTKTLAHFAHFARRNVVIHEQQVSFRHLSPQNPSVGRR